MTLGVSKYFLGNKKVLVIKEMINALKSIIAIRNKGEKLCSWKRYLQPQS